MTKLVPISTSVHEKFKGTKRVKVKKPSKSVNPLVRVYKQTVDGFMQHFWMKGSKQAGKGKNSKKADRSPDSKPDTTNLTSDSRLAKLKHRTKELSKFVGDKIKKDVIGLTSDAVRNKDTVINIMDEMTPEKTIGAFSLGVYGTDRSANVKGQSKHNITIQSVTSRKRGIMHDKKNSGFEDTEASASPIIVMDIGKNGDPLKKGAKTIDSKSNGVHDIDNKFVKIGKQDPQIVKGELEIIDGQRLDINGVKYGMLDGKQLHINGKPVDISKASSKKVKGQLVHSFDGVDGKQMQIVNADGSKEDININVDQFKIKDVKRAKIDGKLHKSVDKHELVKVYKHEEDGKMYNETLFEIHKRWKAGGATQETIDAYTFKLLEMVGVHVRNASRDKDSKFPTTFDSKEKKKQKSLIKRAQKGELKEFRTPDAIVIPPTTFTTDADLTSKERKAGVQSDQAKYGTPEEKAKKSLHHRVAERLSQVLSPANDADTGKPLDLEDVLFKIATGEEDTIKFEDSKYSSTTLGTKKRQVKNVVGGEKMKISNRGPEAEKILRQKNDNETASGAELGISKLADSLGPDSNVWVIDDNVDTGATHWALSKMFAQKGIRTDNIALFDMKGIRTTDRGAIVNSKAAEGEMQYNIREFREALDTDDKAYFDSLSETDKIEFAK